jgi:hypothetical protein
VWTLLMVGEAITWLTFPGVVDPDWDPLRLGLLGRGWGITVRVPGNLVSPR